jgi:NADH pyrophosphatase NudC (nudix superfamily)
MGWALTRWIRKSNYCSRCGSRQRLHLHHRNYNGYHVLGVFAFVIPDMISDMETLCARHHAQQHKKGKK